MRNLKTNLAAIFLLALMFVLGLLSIKDMSLTMDESAHIPAGYSYVKEQDFRLNPEHPPLIKDLAGLPLLALNLNFPENHPSWTEGINNQWWFGNQFLFKSGNDADKIIFAARLPMIFITVILGIILFWWTRKNWGDKVALMVLFLFSLSPTFLAHGVLVTTDVGAALGFFLATVLFLEFLKKPEKKNIVLAGIALGLALLLKFSTVLLFPFFIVITFVYLLFESKNINNFLKISLKYLGFLTIIGIISATLIWLVYQINIINYPKEKQIADTSQILSSNPVSFLVKTNLFMAKNDFLRPWAHYLLGVVMATQRVGGGNTTYFLGTISNQGTWYYFPLVYLVKEQLSFHILTLMAIVFAFWLAKKKIFQISLEKLKNFLRTYFKEFSMVIFLLIYWLTSITGNLNLGIRHVLPTFPFVYILVSLGITKLLSGLRGCLWRKYFLAFTAILLLWYGLSSVFAFPNFLSYFNVLGGGSENGYKIVVDSNYDWGQDLERLKDWVEKNKVEKIYIDYFGGSDASYYFNDKFKEWHAQNPPETFPKGNYLAISATFLQNGQGASSPNFNYSAGQYNWLKNYTPIARPGPSIFVYYID